jgi:hypothetical protein
MFRIVKPGLNLEAMCCNKSCEAYKKITWVQKGFGRFNIAKELLNCVCPLCKI